MTASTVGRTIAVGDVHGCAHALHGLIDVVDPGPNDRLVCLGDFMDQGRDTRDAIDLLIHLSGQTQLITLLGNHEEMFLAALSSKTARHAWLQCGGFATLNSYRFGADIDVVPEEHIEFVRACRRYLETETHIFVHAGYLPDLPLPEQPDYVLRWKLLEPSEAMPHRSGKTAILGHTEQRSGEVLDLGFLKCIDTYCCGNRWLTGLDVDSGEIWQVSRWGVPRALVEAA